MMTAIPYCNSVARWRSEFQGYEQYVEFIPPTNFELRVGYPYYVNVTENVIWVTGSHDGNAGHGLMKQHASGMTLGGVPHLVYGAISDDEGLNYSELSLKAYILNREHDQLTEVSPGCSISADLWFWVQCASFAEAWSAGEQIRIDIYVNESPDVWKIFQSTLTDNPADEALENVSAVGRESEMPAGYGMLVNYPNPFNASTMIDFHVPGSAHVRLTIYNVNGQRIVTLVDEDMSAGRHQMLWHGTSDTGAEVSSGIYMIHLLIKDRKITNKMLLMK
jgi:hypothetical protein